MGEEGREERRERCGAHGASEGSDSSVCWACAPLEISWVGERLRKRPNLEVAPSPPRPATLSLEECDRLLAAIHEPSVSTSAARVGILTAQSSSARRIRRGQHNGNGLRGRDESGEGLRRVQRWQANVHEESSLALTSELAVLGLRASTKGKDVELAMRRGAVRGKCVTGGADVAHELLSKRTSAKAWPPGLRTFDQLSSSPRILLSARS